jgi:hypothetical protein
VSILVTLLLRRCSLHSARESVLCLLSILVQLHLYTGYKQTLFAMASRAILVRSRSAMRTAATASPNAKVVAAANANRLYHEKVTLLQ